MTTDKNMTAPVHFCMDEGKRFWQIKGKYWWSSGTCFSTAAYKAILQDAFGSEVTIETFCYDIENDEKVD